MKHLYSAFLFCTLSVCAFAQTKVIAHRGHWDVDNSAQNSITSIYKAYETGCFGAELDVYITADEKFIVFHDDIIDGMKIVDTPYYKMRDHKLQNGEMLPTLDQYLVHAKNCTGLKIVLEMKPCKTNQIEAMVRGILDRIDQFGLHSRTEYISFSMPICREIIRVNPSAEVSYLSGDVSPEELKKMGFTGLDYHFSAFTNDPSLVTRAHEQGLIVNAWTVNDPVMMKRLIGMGVDYITTDKPVLLQQMLKEFALENAPIN